MIRVLAEHSPSLYSFIGLVKEEKECPATLEMRHPNGPSTTYYRARSAHRWVLYRAALSGHGQGPAFHPQQK